MRMITNRFPQSCHNDVDYEYHRHLVDGGLLPRRRIMMSMTMAPTWTIVVTADMSKPRKGDRTIMIVAVVVITRINNGPDGSNDVVTTIITTMQEEINSG
jgi:hypothetical protein